MGLTRHQLHARMWEARWGALWAKVLDLENDDLATLIGGLRQQCMDEIGEGMIVVLDNPVGLDARLARIEDWIYSGAMGDDR